MPVIEVQSLSKSFRIPSTRLRTVREHVLSILRPRKFRELRVLDGVTFDLEPGETLGIMGRNGCGKSTLLYILGGLEPPSSGTVTLGGRNPYQLAGKELAAFRNKEIGFVFQDHHLLPQCSAIENVLTPTLVAQQAANTRSRPVAGSNR